MGKRRRFDFSQYDVSSLLAEVPQMLSESDDSDFRQWNALQLDAYHDALKLASKNRDESLQWARIAVLVGAWLVLRAPDVASREWSCMTFRINMIKRLGCEKGHDILDPQSIAGWFRQRLPMTIEKYRSLDHGMFYTWPSPFLEQIRSLRGRIDLLKELREMGCLPSEDGLEEWIHAAGM